MISRFALGFLFASTAFAGGQGVGNGGHGVVGNCYRGQGPTKDSLDIYEAKVRFGRTIELGAPTLDPYAKVAYALNRLQMIDPDRAKMYGDYLATFKSEAVFYYNNESLPNIDDYGSYLRLPPNCSVRQIAVQKEPISPPIEKRYEIDGIAFDDFDTNDARASLILHEIIYRDALEHDHRNSVNVRFLNGIIMSKEISAMTKAEYNEYLLQRNFLGYPARLGPYNQQAETARLFLTPMTFADAEKFCKGLDAQGGLAPSTPSQTIAYSYDPYNQTAILLRDMEVAGRSAEFLRFWFKSSIKSVDTIVVGRFARGGEYFPTSEVKVADSSKALALPMCWTPKYNIFGS